MKPKLTMMVVMTAACAVTQLTAMPTEEEAKRAEPVVQKLLASEREAFASGKKTRSEVAAAAMKLADKADTDAAKLLLMKGAFVLYVQDGNLEKAVETMKALETAISDMPPQSVTNMIKTALLGVPQKVDGARLYKLLDGSKTNAAENEVPKVATSANESATETKRQIFSRMFPGWQTSVEPAIESSHRGQDNVAFVHPPSQQTPAVVSRTLTLSNGNPCLFLKMASFDGGSDFLLSVLVNGKEVLPKRLICTPDYAPWRDITVPLSAWRGSKVKIEVVLTANNWWCEHPFFKRLEVAEGTGREKFDPEAKESYGGYTWSYRVDNDEATIVAEKDGKYSCAVSPMPEGNVSIPATLNGVKVTSIGRDAFKKCTGLTSVTIPEGVKYIDSGAFCDCVGLTSVTIPEGVEVLGWHVFRRCNGLTSVTIPSSMTNIHGSAFIDMEALTSFQVESGNRFYKSENGLLITKDGTTLVHGVNGDVTIPSSVTTIGLCAFEGCIALRSVSIPSGVKNIDAYAFKNCRGVSDVALPLGVTNIGYQVFWGCGLTSVTIPDGVANIGEGAFFHCAKLSSVTFPSSLQDIGRYAFALCRGLKAVTLPDGLTKIGANAFTWCSGLKSVEIPSGVKDIGNNAFERCVNLESVTFRGEVPNGFKDVFKDCSKLKSIHVPANAKSWAGMKEWQGIPLVFDTGLQTDNSGNEAQDVEYKFSYRLENGTAIITGIDPKPVGTVVIPDKIDGHLVTAFEKYPAPSPFDHCDRVTKVVLPAGMKGETFDPGGFITCKSLSSIEVSEANKDFASLDGVLYSKDFSTLFVYPKTRESVKLSPKTRKIRVCAFRGCALKTAKIPEGIVEVENWNLCWCPDLESIEFPKSLKHLGHCAANGNDKLKKIVFNGDAPQVGLAQFTWGTQYVFTGAPENLVVEVRKGSKGWKSPESTELPERWPANQKESRPIRYISEARSNTITATAVAAADTTRKTSSTIPTPDEIKAVTPKVVELTRADFAALKSKKKTHAETADALLGYIGADDEPAAKYLLRQEAFRRYVLGAAFDKADELYSAVRGENGVEYAVGVVGRAKNSMFKPASKQLRDRIAADERAVKAINAIKADLAKSPKNAKLHEQLALTYVAIGDWESALFAFRDCKGDEVSKVAAWELSDKRGNDYDAAKVARFWWDFAEKRTNGKQAAEMAKVHAANWYKKAVALNLLSGLDAKVASKRIEECEAFSAQTAVKERKEKGLYMIVDLTKTGKKAISYLDDAPKNGWSDEFRTTKIALRKIAPGSFEYRPGKSFKITKPFYIGVFEITQKQYEKVMQKNPSEFKGDMMPVERVGYFDIRGRSKGQNWPKDNEVDNDSYLGKLRKRFGLDFDLPTEVQWEYACRAGTKGDFNVDGVELAKLGKCKDNYKPGDHHVKVGSFLPNAWGIYDMHGNVWEFCLDRGKDFLGWVWFGWNSEPKETDTDPKGPAVGTSRIIRGAAWDAPLGHYRSSSRCHIDSYHTNAAVGFRLACPVGPQ